MSMTETLFRGTSSPPSTIEASSAKNTRLTLVSLSYVIPLSAGTSAGPS